MEIRICLLQVPRIWLDGKEITFPLRRADALVFYLVCNRTATREEVISLLWDQIDTESGRRNLRNLLYVIKKTMGTDFIISSQKTRLSLNPDIKVDCDYLRFMECGEYMLMHGPFLNGFGIKDSCAFDEWVDQTRSRIQTQYLAYLTEQVKLTTQVGVVGRAERCALEYLQRSPSDEQMVRFLISLYRSQARYFDGIQIYQQLHQYLSQEMGITPLAETVQLYRQVLNEWNLAVFEPSDLATEEYLLPSRQHLMHHIHKTLFPSMDLPQQATRSIWLKGNAGTGKSFLASQYLNKLETDVIVLQSKCSRSNRSEKLSVWQPMVATLRHIVSMEPQSFSKLAVSASEQFSTGLLQNSVLKEVESSIYQLLISVLEKHRILILCENVQWADADSIFLLRRLLQRFQTHPISCLLLGRDTLPPNIKTTINALKEDSLLDVCVIHNFSLEEVQEYIQSNLSSIAAEFAAPIFEATEGNPSLLNKMILSCNHDASDSKILLQQIGQINEYRLEMLSSDALELITWASLFPIGTQETVLYRLLDRSPDDFRLALDETLNLNLLQTEEIDSGAVIVFKDEQYRQRVYSRLSLMSQKEMHQQIGRVLEEELIHTNEFRQVEYHYRKADDLVAVTKVQNTHCEQFLKSFNQTESDRFLSELYFIESEIAPELLKCTFVLDQIQEENTRWISLLLALCSLFSGRHQEAFQKLESIFEVENTHRYSLFHTSLYLISYWAWKENCGNALADGVKSHCSDMMSLLKGELYSIAGSYSFSEAVLLSAAYNNDLFISGYASYLLGMNNQRQNKIEAGHWYDRAISIIADIPIFWGISHVYRDAGRWAWAHRKELSAQSLLKCALHLATETNDLRTLATTQAYLAALIFSEGNIVLSVQLLQEAQAASTGLTALEQGAVCLSKARILCACKQPGNPTGILCNLVTKDAGYYARRGLMLLYPFKDVNLERSMLRECLSFKLCKQSKK